MAELREQMTHREAAAHLRGEVMNTARNETSRLVTPKNPAFFGAVRGVMCDLDYVAALYCGWNGKQHHKIATKEKTIRFIREVLPAATGDDGYREWGKHLYFLYRCGLVHHRHPKLLRSRNSSTKALGWALMYEREGEHEEAGQRLQLRHLELVTVTAELAYLPVSVKALFDDFLAGCECYATQLETEVAAGGSELIERWRETADALSQPEPTKLTW